MPLVSLQSCSHILLGDKLYKEQLRKMRNPKIDPLRKSDLMKMMVKKCSTMVSNKAVKCTRCGEMNGISSTFVLINSILLVIFLSLTWRKHFHCFALSRNA